MSDNLVAFVLAAGFSSRMGAFKPLLPLGKETVLERSIRLFRDAEIKDIRVVVGYRASELEPILVRCGVRSIENPLYRQGMFSSIQAAVQTIEDNDEAFFILPVDIPLIRPSTIHALVSSFLQSRGEIIYPCFLKERGHPPLISRRLVDDIVHWQGDGGLQAVLSSWERCACDVDVPDEGILLDMDQYEDYWIMGKKAEYLDIPTKAECQALLIIVEAGDKILRHGQAVADMAVRLGKALNMAGCRLNLRLLKAAGLLHDIAKGQSENHAEKGAEMIWNWGYQTVSYIVAAHTDITFLEGEPIREREVLYLADKLVRGEQRVSIQERFRTAVELYADNPEISVNVARRLHNALMIQQRMESILGCSIEDIPTIDECDTTQSVRSV